MAFPENCQIKLENGDIIQTDQACEYWSFCFEGMLAVMRDFDNIIEELHTN